MKLTDLCLNQDYLRLNAEFYQILSPRPLRETSLLDMNEDLFVSLGVAPEMLDKEELRRLINGETCFKQTQPYAMCYAGHQFGFYTPRLGDGRAINLGSFKDQHLQLKGSGPTLYSRNGDGRATLRSSVREYLMSEAMFHLHIPTTRALGIISSNELIQRDQEEKGAILLRSSTSWIRFGHFEYFFYKRKYHKVKMLLDYTITDSYPHLQGRKHAYILFFEELIERTARLIAQWQSLGFTHGVMNTDNMSIAGLTLDYGPFSFFDRYDSEYVCNHSDNEGRYSFGNQPYIAQWNLSKLMHSLTPLIDEAEMQKALDRFRGLYTKHYTKLMLNKLGLEKEFEEDRLFLRSLLKLLQNNQTDYTRFFRLLCRYDGDIRIFAPLDIDSDSLTHWIDTYDTRCRKESSTQQQRMTKMLRTNPKYILKNHLLQEAIEGLEKGDRSSFETLKRLSRSPFDEHREYESYAAAPVSTCQNLQLSCSS